MGDYTRSTGYGYEIRCFSPDDTHNSFFIHEEENFEYILERAREKWGSEISLSSIQIKARYIQTDCLGYDQYDPFDYANYLEIIRIK